MYTRRKRSVPGPDDVLRQTLPNGLTLLARENFLSPAVVVRGYVEVGAEDEPRELCGLASFTAQVMERGTEDRPFAQLYEAVESIGARFGVSGGVHITTFGAKGLAEHLPLLLDILADVLRRPAFRPDQVEKVRAELMTYFQERAQSPRHMAELIFDELAYPEAHPYHVSTMGYPETIARIGRDELAAFHRRYFAPRGGVIVIVGAVRREEALRLVAETLGTWEADRPARAELPDVPPPEARRERRVTIPDKAQAALVLGWPGPPRRHPDFLRCHLANTVLGVFGMYGRLGERVREENGLAYYVFSDLAGGTGPGAWRVVAGVAPDQVDRVVDLIRVELRRLRDELVPRDELADSQSFLVGSLPLRLETNEGVARTLLHIERHGLGLDYLHRYRELIERITPWEVQRVARAWLDPDRFALAVAGPEVTG